MTAAVVEQRADPRACKGGLDASIERFLHSAPSLSGEQRAEIGQRLAPSHAKSPRR